MGGLNKSKVKHASEEGERALYKNFNKVIITNMVLSCGYHIIIKYFIFTLYVSYGYISYHIILLKEFSA